MILHTFGVQVKPKDDNPQSEEHQGYRFRDPKDKLVGWGFWVLGVLGGGLGA